MASLNGLLISPSPSPVLETPPDSPHHRGLKLTGYDKDESADTLGDISSTGREKRSNSFPQRELGVLSTSSSNQRRSTTASSQEPQPQIQKLSAARIKELTAEPDSIPVRIAPQGSTREGAESNDAGAEAEPLGPLRSGPARAFPRLPPESERSENGTDRSKSPERTDRVQSNTTASNLEDVRPPSERSGEEKRHRTQTPQSNTHIPPSSMRKHAGSASRRLEPLKLRTDGAKADLRKEFHESKDIENIDPRSQHPMASPPPSAIPLPPFSLPTYLHLELSSDRPSPLYIQPTPSNQFQFESSKVKFERLVNFLLLPPQLEQLLLFGALTCLDAWLYIFTILPLRFLRALWILFVWLCTSLLREALSLWSFFYDGLGRLWNRHRRRRAVSTVQDGSSTAASSKNDDLKAAVPLAKELKAPPKSSRRGDGDRRREASKPSLLQPNHKADILKGLLIIASCTVLMRFDASKMYHTIRGQATIKLYVIYNVLEVCDRLFSALGQDILECLFSSETLERKSNGRSKVARPFWMFLLALVYTVIHATALFYQVVTLNVAVNSYSNALLTLLMSNQFVEIKGTVFKKFEKENLFQLTCADVVERFQLWFMLLIIALRNIVELGGLSLVTSDFTGPSSSSSTFSNASSNAPFRSSSIIPSAFNILPSLFPAHVFGPFLVVLGSEMLVDWLKHAYITKFNVTSTRIYGRFFDVLAKDYYANAFTEPNMTRRLGLPVVPLACLFIRAMLQTYHMFLATNVSPPVMSPATSLTAEANATASPVIAQIDHIFRSALGRSSFGGGISDSGFWSWSIDDVVALATMLVFFLALYLVLLAFKLALGMVLLSVARERYRGMREREEKRAGEAIGKRVGGWGVVQVDEDKRKWIYEDDPDGLKAARKYHADTQDKDARGGSGKTLEGVQRYSMVTKRIW